MKNQSKTSLIVLLISLMLFSCSSKEVKKAKEFMDAAMYEQAISYLELEIQDNPKNAKANYLLGKCYMETDDYDYEEIQKCFDRAILLDSDYKEMIANIFFDKSLELYIDEEDYEAEDYYEEGLEYNPTYKSDFAQKLFDYTCEFSETSTDAYRSMKLFEITDEISPDYKSQIAEKNFALAKTFIEKGFIEEGFEFADFGIEYDPKHIKDVADLYFGYGKELVDRLNEPYESIKYFDRSIELNSNKTQELATLYNTYALEYEKNTEIELLLFFGKKCVEYDSNYKTWFLEIEDKYDPKFTDNRDGNRYGYVTIGEQVWMSENLRYEPSQGNYWASGNDERNVEDYGYLYDWEISQQVCPSGWHLPSDDEWKQMEIYLGMSRAEVDIKGRRGTDEGGKLKEAGTTHWTSHNEGATNESGFTAFPGGHHFRNGTFYGFGDHGGWWSSSEGGTKSAWVRSLAYNNASVDRLNFDKYGGFSVRCVQDL